MRRQAALSSYELLLPHPQQFLHRRQRALHREGSREPEGLGSGTFRAINGTVSSGPSDSWLTPDAAYLYQIDRNASKLVGRHSSRLIASRNHERNNSQQPTGFGWILKARVNMMIHP
jgi:hypothetical protein